MTELFSTEAFMPHGHCYLWQPGILWVQVATNGLIGLAYVAISATLLALVWKVREVPFKFIYLSFGAFIVACGATHFSDIWMIWDPEYWVDGGIRVVTAIASVITAIVLPRLVPEAAGLVRSAQAAKERGLELETMFRDLEHVHERTVELEQAKTQFFANVSHELRTPITLILGPIEQLLARGGLDARQEHDLEVVRRNARTLLKHVNDLLAVARLESTGLSPSYARVDLAARLRDRAAQFRALAASRSMMLEIDAPESLVAEVDVEQIDQIAMNLLGNAFKFTPAGGIVRWRLAVQPASRNGGARQRGEREIEMERVVFEVADSGPGIPAADRERVFERFQQVDGTASRAFGGTGLGLALVHDYVALHGGVVRVDVAPEGGALLHAEIPRWAPSGAPVAEHPPVTDEMVATALSPIDTSHAARPTDVEPSEDLAPDAPRRAKHIASSPLVLVVEDQVDMNRFVREALTPRWRTVAAFDGQEGLEKARALRPDLIICDIMMPRVSGEDLLTSLRAEEDLADVPVIMLTAKAEPGLPARLLSRGAHDFLAKPFSVAELRARAQNLLSMRRTRAVLERELAQRSGTLEELAEQIAEQKRHLETSLDAVRVARDQAERASSLKTNLLRLVSHELRAPLAVIQLQLDLFELDPEAAPLPPQEPLVRRIADSTRRLRTMIDAMLLQARIETGRLDLDRSTFDAGALAVDVTDELRAEAERAGLELRVEPPAEPCQVESDARLVRLVLGSLVTNALKFTARGRVDVAVACDARQVVFAVRDTGPGISPADRSRIFEPFAQLEDARAKHLAGVGLGLALVREIVAALGGRIDVESEVGSGSTFSVRLPRAPAPEGLTG
jgi:signal transduction histidine kinase